MTAAAQASVGALFAQALHGHPAQNFATGPVDSGEPEIAEPAQ